MSECLQEDCWGRDQVVDRYVFESTDGPIEHVALECTYGHRFVVAADSVKRFRARKERGYEVWGFTGL